MQLRVDKWWGNRKELATVRTICSHVQNMIKGVTLVSCVWNQITAALFVACSEGLLLHGGRAFISIQDAASFSLCFLSCLPCQASSGGGGKDECLWGPFSGAVLHLGCSFPVSLVHVFCPWACFNVRLCPCPRASATRCARCTLTSPSTWSSRRTARWWRSATSWERSTSAE